MVRFGTFSTNEFTTMKRHVLLFVAATAVSGWFCQAKADRTIFSNFGPGQSYLPDYYSVSGGGGGPRPPTGYGFAIAESFVPTANFSFTSVTLPMGITPDNGVDLPPGANAFTISLMSDQVGHPGSMLEIFSVTNVPLRCHRRARTLQLGAVRLRHS
jgi:hypothetical protein